MQEALTGDDLTVDQARAGSQDAFRRLYEMHRGQVYRIAFRYMRSVPDAEDIMQETFIKAFSRIQDFDFRADASFATWLVSICINTAIDHLRRRERRREKMRISLSDLGQELPTGDPPPEEVASRRQELERLRESLQILSQRQRVVFDLRYDRHLEIKAIAGCLGCSESNIKTQLSRSLEKLRKALRPNWRET